MRGCPRGSEAGSGVQVGVESGVGGWQSGKRWVGGCKGAKGQTFARGEFNQKFLQLEFRFRKMVGCTLILQTSALLI